MKRNPTTVRTHKDNMTPAQVAKIHGVSTVDMVSANVHWHSTITAHSKLKTGTMLMVPPVPKNLVLADGLNHSALCASKRWTGKAADWKRLCALPLSFQRLNPKKADTRCFNIYERYKVAKTLGEFDQIFRQIKLEESAYRKNNSSCSCRMQLKWDALARFVTGPAVDGFLELMTDKPINDKRHMKALTEARKKRKVAEEKTWDDDYVSEEPTPEETFDFLEDRPESRQAAVDADTAISAVKLAEEPDVVVVDDEEIMEFEFSDSELDRVHEVIDEMNAESAAQDLLKLRLLSMPS